MANHPPGSQQRPQTPNQQGTNTTGSQDRNKPGQMEQSGRQNQPGGSQPRERDSDPGVSKDKEKDRGKSGAQRPD
jgi:hypothetical protein